MIKDVIRFMLTHNELFIWVGETPIGPQAKGQYELSIKPKDNIPHKLEERVEAFAKAFELEVA